MNINLLQPNNPQTKLYIDTIRAADTISLITLPTRITCASATLMDHINFSGLDKFNTNAISTGNLFFEIAAHKWWISQEKTVIEKTFNDNI